MTGMTGFIQDSIPGFSGRSQDKRMPRPSEQRDPLVFLKAVKTGGKPFSPQHFGGKPPAFFHLFGKVLVYLLLMFNLWGLHARALTCFLYVFCMWVFPTIRGTPKSSILIGFSIINHPFWGTPIFGNTHVLALTRPAKLRPLLKVEHLKSELH